MPKVHSSIIAVLFVASLAACSGSSTGSSSSSGAAALTSVDSLPRATAPVVGSDSNLSAMRSVMKAATTGVTLNDLSGDDYTENSSMAMCETSQVLKGLFREAAMGDTILCYISQMFSDEAIAANEDLSSIDLYDGNAHTFDLDFGNAEEEAFRVQFSITKDSSGNITDFELKTCEGGSQAQYLHQTIDGNAFTMTNVETFNDDFGTGGQQITVTGTLNASGEFTSKNMVSDYSSNWGNGTGYGRRTLEQSADSAIVTQFDTGTWTWINGEDSDEGTYENHILSYAELLNTDDVATMAIGDGVATGTFSGTCCNDQDYEDDFEQGWDGDTTLVADQSDLLTLIADELIPDSIAQPTVAFTGSMAYDCGGTNVIELSFDEDEIGAACNDSMDYEWLNCYDIIENGNAPAGE